MLRSDREAALKSFAEQVIKARQEVEGLNVSTSYRFFSESSESYIFE